MLLRADLCDLYMRIHKVRPKVRHILDIYVDWGPMHLWQDPPGGCPRMQNIQFKPLASHLRLANLNLGFS